MTHAEKALMYLESNLLPTSSQWFGGMLISKMPTFAEATTDYKWIKFEDGSELEWSNIRQEFFEVIKR